MKFKQGAPVHKQQHAPAAPAYRPEIQAAGIELTVECEQLPVERGITREITADQVGWLDAGKRGRAVKRQRML